ncbi:hypothetical protein N2152v2_010953 [Parachlorella kessleri]
MVPQQALRSSLTGAQEGRSKLLVVDVRDDDYVGGHIVGGTRFSVDNFQDDDWRQLVDGFIKREILSRDLETVVVHCFLCQQRGPFCAKRLASRLQNLELEEPRVCILRNGFKGFKELYGNDPQLIAGDEEECHSATLAVKAPEACCGAFAPTLAEGPRGVLPLSTLSKPALMA